MQIAGSIDQRIYLAESAGSHGPRYLSSVPSFASTANMFEVTSILRETINESFTIFVFNLQQPEVLSWCNSVDIFSPP